MEHGCLAEFATPDALLAALARLRALGYARLETYTPFPVEGVEAHLGIRRSRIPVVAGLSALAGGIAAYAIQWWCSAVSYPLNVGGRPLHSAPAFIPITFEMSVLGAATAIVVALLWCVRLPRLWHPVFQVDGFERASIDRFWLGVDVTDPRFVAPRLEDELRELGALRVANVGREP
jgi:hypothetical protein